MSGTTRGGKAIGLATCVGILLLGTAVLLPFAGPHKMMLRILSLQIYVPVLILCFWRYIWNFGLIDSTSKSAKGRHFSSLNPETQMWLRMFLKWGGTIVCLWFLIGILLPLELKATKLLMFGGVPWKTARVTAINVPSRGAIFHESLTIMTWDGQSIELGFYLPGRSLRLGSTYSFLILPGTSLIADAR